MDKYQVHHGWMLEIIKEDGESYCKDLRELISFLYSFDPKAPLNYTMVKSFCEANGLDYGDFINFITYSPHIKPMRGELAFYISKLENDIAKAYKKHQQGW